MTAGSRALPRPGPRPARYFPVKPGQKLRAGLMPFGVDLGNGVADRQYFQVDDQYGHYLAEKDARDARGLPRRARHGWLDDTEPRRRAHAAVLAWMRATLAREHPAIDLGRSDESGPYRTPYDRVACHVQEDLAVVQRRPARGGGGSGGDEARSRGGGGSGRDEARGRDDDGPYDQLIMAHVCFPSDWPSDRVLGHSFQRIHGPVPGFADRAAAAASMVDAMIERGPYVRFVWSLCPDAYLDHHPEHGRRDTWRDDLAEGWLRVERQVTVPFPAVGASLFLIRTYLYPFSSLDPGQRRVLADALDRMPADALRYKHLDGPRVRIQGLLARAGR